MYILLFGDDSILVETAEELNTKYTALLRKEPDLKVRVFAAQEMAMQVSWRLAGELPNRTSNANPCAESGGRSATYDRLAHLPEESGFDLVAPVGPVSIRNTPELPVPRRVVT